MAKYHVEWFERTPHWCKVEADSEEEAIAKAVLGEVIEGSQDTGIGKKDNRTIWAKLFDPYRNGGN